MTSWNPEQIRQVEGLYLSELEKETILKKLPKADDGQYYADAVFEGGGVKGIAFLGALRCCSDIGIKWKKVAGTSAGAITAALVAADFTTDELEKIFGELDFQAEFLSKKNFGVLNGSPEDDLSHPLRMIANLTLINKLGEYSSTPFKEWLEKTLGDRLPMFDKVRWADEKALKIVVSDLSRGEMLVLPDDLEQDDLLKQLQLGHPHQFSIAEAVRLSMSIPFFFEPGDLAGRLIVDGGILSNFPLWIYDVNSELGPRTRLPRWATFGFRLVEEKNQLPPKIDKPLAILSGMMQTMMVAKDRFHLRKNGQGRVINIDITAAKVTTTQFNLNDDDKNRLYCLGYRSAKDFFLNHWDWEKHLQSRGYYKSVSIA